MIGNGDLLNQIYTHQKSLATLDGETVDPEIAVKTWNAAYA